jgi:hypothetical protein
MVIHFVAYRVDVEGANRGKYCIFFFPVPVCAIAASGGPGGTLVSMNRFSILPCAGD